MLLRRFSLLLGLLLLLDVTLSPARAMSGVPELTAAQESRAITKIVEHHSFSPPNLKHYYAGAEMAYWDIRGSTVVTDSYVRLTPDEPSQVGHMWNRHPIGMPQFEIYLGVSVPRKSNGADGLALWVTQYNPTETRLANGQLFGHPMNFKGFGILMDTYDNDGLRDNPTIGLLLNDGSSARVFSPQKDFHDDYVSSCMFDFRMPSKSNHFATIHLIVAEDGSVSVYASRNSEESEELCFTVSGVHLNVTEGPYYIGLTAETGSMSQLHDVVFLHTLPVEGATYDHDVHTLRETEGDFYASRTPQKGTKAAEPQEEKGEEEETDVPSPAEDSASHPPPTPAPTAAPTPSPTPSVDVNEVKKMQEEIERLKKMAELHKKGKKTRSRREEPDDEEDDDEDEDEDEEQERDRRRKVNNRKKKSTKSKK